MINFVFNIDSHVLKTKLKPQNTFTEIDAVASLFGIERYEGEKYKDFSPFLQRVSLNGMDSSSLLKIFEVMRSEFFCMFFSSKSPVNKFLIELTGHYDLIIEEQKQDELTEEWIKERKVYDLSNRKTYPFLSSILTRVREDFPWLEVRTLGLTDEDNLSVSGLSILPFKNYESITYNFAREENLVDSLAPSDIEVPDVFEEFGSTAFNSTNQFFLDRTSMRLTLQNSYLDEFSLRTKRVEEMKVAFGFRGDSVFPLQSQELFRRFVKNNTFESYEFTEYGSSLDSTITALEETPLYLKTFYEAEPVGGRW